MKHLSIRQVLLVKIARKLEKKSLSAICRSFRWFLGFAGVSIMLIAPRPTIELAIKFTQAGGGGYYRVAILFLVIVYKSQLKNALRAIYDHIAQPLEKVFDANSEIVNFLEQGTINRDQLVQKLHIPRDEADDLLAELDDLEVTVRGENNSRMLNPELSFDDILELLEHGCNPLTINNNIDNGHDTGIYGHSPISTISSVFSKRSIY